MADVATMPAPAVGVPPQPPQSAPGANVPAQFMPPFPQQQMMQQAPAGGLKPASTALYVGDINPDISETTLFEVFNAVAPVSTIRVW